MVCNLLFMLVKPIIILRGYIFTRKSEKFDVRNKSRIKCEEKFKESSPPSETWDIVSKVGKAGKGNFGSLFEQYKVWKSAKENQKDLCGKIIYLSKAWQQLDYTLCNFYWMKPNIKLHNIVSKWSEANLETSNFNLFVFITLTET